MRKIEDFQYTGKKVFLRVDLNVPVSQGIIIDDTRINKIIPTINFLLNQNAKIIIASHFGRPKGKTTREFSLEFMKAELEKRLNRQVSFAKNLSDVGQENITLLENLRFFPGEEQNDEILAKKLASLADFYINDAFSCSHRAHSSIAAITKFLPNAAGFLLTEEIENLSKHLTSFSRPSMAIIGGSKISTKLALLNQLSNKVDFLVIGGGMANTFLKALGHEIGSSLYEASLIDEARSIVAKNTCKIILPQDVVAAKQISTNAKNQIVELIALEKDQMILDLGPKTVLEIQAILAQCTSVIVNGPVGVFEHFPFSVATISIARTIAQLTKAKQLTSVAGGGDIVAALSQAGLLDEFSYISTAGGAFLEWLEGKDLPGLITLQ